MRERFSEINIIGSSNAVPVGADAKNITLEDGTVLEQALGDINFQENGSIIDQINEINEKVSGNTSYAPLSAPRIKDAFSVRRYNKDNILAATPHVGETKRGLTAEYQLYQWKVSGVISSGNNATILLYGNDSHEIHLGEPSDYLATIKFNIGNALMGNEENPIVSLRFDLYNSITGETSSIYMYEGDTTKNFTIPINNFLYRICLNIHANNEEINIENGILKFELKNLNDQEQDIYNVVFDVQQNLDNKKWTTTVAENFVVSKGLQSEARSSLGTIYDSKWEGEFDISGLIDIKESPNGNTGVVTHNGLVGFVIDDLNNYTGSTLAEKAANHRQKIYNLKDTTTPFYIAAMYNEGGEGVLRYGAQVSHDFYVGDQIENGESQVYITRDTTKIRNTLDLGDNRVKSNKVIQYIYLENFASIEKILTDNDYPELTPIMFQTGGVLGGWLTWRPTGVSISTTGFAWKGISSTTGERFLTGWTITAGSGSWGFAQQPGFYRFKYCFYPGKNQVRKLWSYKMTNGNPITFGSTAWSAQSSRPLASEGNPNNGFFDGYTNVNSFSD